MGAADSVDGVEEVESDFEVDPSWISGAGADSETSPLFPGSARGPSPKLRAAPRDQYRHGPSTVQACRGKVNAEFPDIHHGKK